MSNGTKRAVTSYVKAVDDDEGTVDKIVSVFGNVDLHKDRILPGAFAGTLERWKTSGDPIPVIFSHRWNDLDAHVGVAEDAEEWMPGDERLPDELKDLGGLFVRERYDMDQPTAARLFELQKQRRIKESSFAYDVLDSQRAKGGVTDLTELELIEEGPTLKGANPSTTVLDTKAGEKAFVRLDGSYEQLMADLNAEIRAWAPTAFPNEDLFVAGLEATFADRLVAYVETWDEPLHGGRYFEATYSRGEDGAVTIGEPVEVGLTGVTFPKALTELAAEKKTRRAPAPKARYSDPASVLAELDVLALS